MIALRCKYGLILIALSLMLASGPLQARPQTISLPVFEELQQVQEKIEAGDLEGARNGLRRMLEPRRRLNNYESAQVWSLYGSIYVQEEDYDQALKAFETALGFENLPQGFMLISLRTLAQLSFMQERFIQALDYTRRMMALTETPDANHNALLAQIHYRMDDFPSALREMRAAIDIQRSRGSSPPENWLLILNAIYFSLNDYTNMVEVLKELIALYPSERYVLNLAAVYGQLEQTERQLVLMEPLFDQGRLTRESELVNLANLMLLHRVPYKGARVIEQGMAQGLIQPNQRIWELLAQSWQLAAEDERSLEALLEAARLAQDGNASFRLAQAYASLYRWADAEQALEAALKKGDLRRPGDAQVLLGMVRFHQRDFRNARLAFRAAANHDETARLSEQWLVYLDQELAKEEALRDD